MPRIHYFDLLNVFACISVVALHCNGYTHTYAHNTAWHQALIFEVIFYAAVPIFFMLSGATLFNFRERYPVKEFYKKRFFRTVIPYILFSLILYTLFLFKLFIKIGSFSFDSHHFFSAIMTGHIPFSNYWFFIPLFLFYLFVPFLEKIVHYSSTRALAFLILLIFFFQAIIPIINRFGNLNITQIIPIYGYSVYAFLGFVLNKTSLEENKPFLLGLGILTLLVWAIRYWGLTTLSHRDPFWFNYFGLYAVLPAMLFFLLSKKLNHFLCQHKNFSNKIKTLSSLSFGIYLIHGVVLAILPFDKSSPTYRLVGILLVYCNCALIIYILKKIPILNKIIPS